MDVTGNTVLRLATAPRVKAGMRLGFAAIALAAVLGARSAGRWTPTPRVPVLEYHLVREHAGGPYVISRDEFRSHLQLLYERGYRPITVAQLVDRDFRDVPPGLSPVVFTFDDASPEQFSYVERDGQLEIDSNSVIGMWLAFNKEHPDWKLRATFCLLSGAQAGHSFFGDSLKFGGQDPAWRFTKLRWLADNGFELCNHTVWHGQLSAMSDARVQEQIGRGQLAIDSAVAGYKVRTLALPQGLWPKNRELAWRGTWSSPRTGHSISYDYGTVLEVTGGPAPSPFDSTFDSRRLTRFIVFEGRLRELLDRLDSTDARFRIDIP